MSKTRRKFTREFKAGRSQTAVIGQDKPTATVEARRSSRYGSLSPRAHSVSREVAFRRFSS
jgi:hypothetical protein